MRVQAFCFKGQSISKAVYILYGDDSGHIVCCKPFVHRFNEAIGVRLLCACIGKQNQIDGDAMLMQPDQHCRAVRTAPKGNNIDKLNLHSAAFHSGISFAPDRAAGQDGGCLSMPCRPQVRRSSSLRRVGLRRFRCLRCR